MLCSLLMRLVVLSPIYAGIAIAIKIDDPGPVFFTQKRVGQNKEFFKIHKFRSMKMSTPHDVPTHCGRSGYIAFTKSENCYKHSMDGCGRFGTFLSEICL